MSEQGVKITSGGDGRSTTVVLDGTDVSHRIVSARWECGGIDLARVTLEIGGTCVVSRLESGEVTIVGLEEIPTEILRRELESRDE